MRGRYLFFTILFLSLGCFALVHFIGRRSEPPPLSVPLTPAAIEEDGGPAAPDEAPAAEPPPPVPPPRSLHPLRRPPPPEDVIPPADLAPFMDEPRTDHEEQEFPPLPDRPRPRGLISLAVRP